MLKKILCALMASLMMSATLVSCATGDQTDTGPNEQTRTDTDPLAETRETLDIPDDRYEGAELCFLTRDDGSWSTVEIFTDVKTSEADNISYAVFERNDRILQDYGVTVTELKQASQQAKVTHEVSAPTGDFQVVITDVRSSVALATGGYLWDLRSDSMEAIDVTKPWWDVRMAEGMTIDGHLFFATGDLQTLDNDATFAIMFNKTLAEQSQLPNLYELVDNGKWTMNQLYTLEQLAIQDLDGNGTLSYMSDVLGFAYTDDVPSCMLIAGGVTLCQKDHDDIPYYALDVDRAQSVAEKARLCFTRDYAFNLSDASGGIEEVGKKCFGENHVLFFGECLQCVTRLRGYDVDFGIIPYPKYNEEQGSYYSMMHHIASMVSIPKSIREKDLLMVESMVEALAYHSVDTLTKQYYEINLKTKGAKDAESGPMIDTILANRACDLTYYFNWGYGSFENISMCLFPASTASVASMSQKIKKSIATAIAKDIKKFSALNP